MSMPQKHSAPPNGGAESGSTLSSGDELQAAALLCMATPDPEVMSTPRVSRKNNEPTITVMAATAIGYHKPA
jgi:hypothetical protein